jgi:selenoprotein W-related protein
VELIASSGGVYEVTIDGEKVFSKAQLRRFPQEQEIAEMVRKRQ